MQFANGDKYVGTWDKDTRTGSGSYSWANGNIYDGNFANDEISGEGI